MFMYYVTCGYSESINQSRSVIKYSKIIQILVAVNPKSPIETIEQNKLWANYI